MNQIQKKYKKRLLTNLFFHPTELLVGMALIVQSCRKAGKDSVHTTSAASGSTIEASISQMNLQPTLEEPSYLPGSLIPAELYDGIFIKETNPDRISIYTNIGRDQFKEGMRFFVSNEKEKAIYAFEKGAFYGDPNAMIWLGDMKQKEENWLQAIQWYVFAFQLSFINKKEQPYTLAMKKLKEMARKTTPASCEKEKEIKKFFGTIERFFNFYPSSSFKNGRIENRIIDDIINLYMQGVANQYEFYLSEQDAENKGTWFFLSELTAPSCIPTPEGCIRLGRAYANGRLLYDGKINHQKAIEYYKKAGPLPEAELVLGNYENNIGHFGEAFSHFQNVINSKYATQAELAEACSGIGNLYLCSSWGDQAVEGERYSMALKYYQQSDVPEDLKKALICFVNQNYTEALKYCNKIQEEEPNKEIREAAFSLLIKIRLLLPIEKSANTLVLLKLAEKQYKTNMERGSRMQLGDFNSDPYSRQWNNSQILIEDHSLFIRQLLERIAQAERLEDIIDLLEQKLEALQELEDISFGHIEKKYFFCIRLLFTLYHTNESKFQKKISNLQEEYKWMQDAFPRMALEGAAVKAVLQEKWEEAIHYTKQLIDEFPQRKNEFQRKLDIYQEYLKKDNREQLSPTTQETLQIKPSQEELFKEEEADRDRKQPLLSSAPVPSLFSSKRKEKNKKEAIKALKIQTVLGMAQNMLKGPSKQPTPAPWAIGFVSRKVQKAYETFATDPKFQKIHELMEEIKLYPWATCGAGRPEKLKYQPGFSRRINGGERLFYDLVPSSRRVLILQCGGHDLK